MDTVPSLEAAHQDQYAKQKEYVELLRPHKPKYLAFIRDHPNPGNVEDLAVKHRMQLGKALELMNDPRVRRLQAIEHERNALSQGIPVPVKRRWLTDLVTVTGDPKSEHFNAANAIKSIELLCKIDKDLEVIQTGGNVILNIDTGIHSVTVEPPALEHINDDD